MKVVRLGILVLAAALVAAQAAASAPDGPWTQARVEFGSMDEWRDFVSLPGLDIMR